MSNTFTFNACVTCPKHNSHASLRLFCFPYAGGSSLIFRPWLKSLSTTIEVCPIELPGRGMQILNIPITTFGGLQDPEVSVEQLQGWQEQTHSTFCQQMFPGDHFFLHSAQSSLLQSLSQKLNYIASEISS